MLQGNYRLETIALHAGQETADPATDSRAVPIYQTASYVFHDSQHAADRFGLQEIISNYNQEQNRATIEKTFGDLMRLSLELTEEEKRYIREGFENDEQLSMYDVLMKDDLSKEDIKKLKVVAKDLLEKIKAQLTTMDHPFDKQETRASIIITIRDILWKELPESYSDESINYYRDAVYSYVSQHYGSMS